MSTNSVVQCVLFVVVLTALAVPLGSWIARVYEGKPGVLGRVLGPLERLLLRAGGVRPDDEMTWQRYGFSVLLFGLASTSFVYGVERLQAYAPLNPNGAGAVPAPVGFNTAISFASNTNWQAYAGESAMSHFTQMLALTTQNFLSAACGMAVLVAVIRGLTRAESKTLGSFWVDLVRGTLYVLLPLSVVLALVLVGQGVAQSLHGVTTAISVDGGTQSIAVGPVASQEAIKQLGTNGGGFFNVNSAHPFENPTPISNFLELISILLIPAALCFTFGAMVRDRRQGIALFAAMAVVFVPLVFACVAAEQHGNPAWSDLGVDQTVSALSSGGNMEGKETRFGITNSALWATSTTAASNGSVNAMHDSFTPLGGLVPLALIDFGEVIYGGVGSGLYGMLMHAMIAVFIAGLMVGRTPEYLGKKVEAFEMKMASLVVLIPSMLVLVGTAIACTTPAGTSTLGNPGAHGFSEALYAFSSASNNNGSAFGGLTADGTFYAMALGVCMWLGRFGVIIPVLALAGSLAKKKRIPESAGTLPTHGPLFVTLLVGTVVLVGALTFVPAFALGPLVEHLQMTAR